MYYRFYRRRHSIYLAVAVILVLFVLFNRQDNSDTKDSSKKSGVFGKRDSDVVDGGRRGGARITIDTYQVPPSCNGCPGENGAAVHLTVR